MVKKMNRRRFLSSAGGAGAVLIGCTTSPTDTTQGLDTSKLGTLASTTKTPKLQRPTYFEPLVNAERSRLFAFNADVNQSFTTLKMVIRGLCAVVIWEDAIDIVLMDARKHQMPVHVGKLTVEDRFAAPNRSEDPLEAGVKEADHADYEPIRAWDIRGSIVTLSSPRTLPGEGRVQIAERPMISPWSSMAWQLNLEDVYPEGRLRPRTAFNTTAEGSIAAVVRLTQGVVESVIPGRRYGNTGLWEVARVGNLPEGKERFLVQALTDTISYTLKVPTKQQVTFKRQPLEGYDPGKDPAPRFTPIVLDTPETAADSLVCGISHEPMLGGAVHTSDLRHNRMFYELFENPPAVAEQNVPTLIEQWVDRGLGRESRSAYWSVTRQEQSNQLAVNVCDPNCNLAVFGLNEWRERQKRTKPEKA
jgi:hypothetical protein